MITLRLGSRQSALARVQTAAVTKRLQAAFPDVRVETVFISTSGDQRQEPPHPALSPRRGDFLDFPLLGRRVQGEGGLKALFTKELEEALLDRRIDLAVHSLKDMAADLPPGLVLAAVPEREDPRDAWIGRDGIAWASLPTGARVGTGALRRQAQLRHLRPDLAVVPMRGNVDTRLRKLAEENVQGIVLAMAGLRRLGRAAEATEPFSVERMLPAIGQGCLAIEARESDASIEPYLACLNHPASHLAARTERAFLSELGGSCQTPIAGYATTADGTIRLDGLVAAPDGSALIRKQETGPVQNPEAVGKSLAQRLIALGAKQLLR